MRVAVMNPKRRKTRKRRKNAAPVSRARTPTRTNRRRRRRRNPVATGATRTNRRRRRRNPFGMKIGSGAGGILGTLLITAAGFYGTKAADFANRNWTYNASTNPATREVIKDAAASGVAVMLPQVARMVGLIKPKDATAATVGGLLYALNRGLIERARASNPDRSTLGGHLLTDYSGMGDYLLEDGGELFDGDLSDYVLADGYDGMAGDWEA